MFRIFGASGKKAAEPEGASPEDITKSIEKGDKRISDLESKIGKCNQELLALKQQLKRTKNPAGQRGVRMRMKNILQRRRMLEQQLNLTYNTTNSMQATAYAIDNASMIADQVSATKSAMVTLRKQHADISLDELEDMQDDMADLLADSAEMSDLMGRSYGLPGELDEGDLDAELEALEDELAGDAFGEGAGYMGEALPAGGVPAASAASMPAGGTHAPAVAEASGGGGLQLDEFGAPVATAV